MKATAFTVAMRLLNACPPQGRKQAQMCPTVIWMLELQALATKKSPEGSKRWANVGQTWDALPREGDGQWGWSLTDEFGVCSRILLEHGSETLKSGLI